MSEQLTTITADIISAFVSHNSIRPDDMVVMLKQVHDKLAEVINGKPRLVAEDKPIPAIPIKKSITHDAVFCLVCGTGHKTLKRHLRTSHELDPAAYRAMFGLDAGYKLTAPSYSETRSDLATKLGLGRKPKVAEAENVVELSKPAEVKKEPLPTKTVRSHSKAEQTRRKTKATKKDQEAASSSSESS